MHEHKTCEHKNIKYCSKCDVVYCEDCKKEWGNYDNTYMLDSETTTHFFPKLPEVFCYNGVHVDC